MGTARYATGLGRAVAWFWGVVHNRVQDRVERSNDQLKMLLIRASMGAQVTAAVELTPVQTPHYRTA